MNQKFNYKDSDSLEDIITVLSSILTENTAIVCIGTDKVLGDSIGPLVGTLLREQGFPLAIYGTLNYPVHGKNLEEIMDGIYNRYSKLNIIGIDATLGKNIGEIIISDKPLTPGSGVNKLLPKVGNYSIKVCTAKDEEALSYIHSTLGLVYYSAKLVSTALVQAYSVYNLSKVPTEEEWEMSFK